MRTWANTFALWRFRTLIALIVIAGLVLPAVPAQAIIGSASDDGNNHPYVGGLWRPLLDPEPNRVRATGFLVAPNVLLTEANSFDNGRKVAVSFQNPITDFEDNPGDTVYSGYLFLHPKAGLHHQFLHWKNMAVVILDAHVQGISPTTLAPIGTLDAANPNNPMPLTMVSFGPTVNDQEADSDFVRRSTDGLVESLTQSTVQLALSEHTFTCFGDTGAPILSDSGVVALTSFWSGICGTEGAATGYRLDTPDAWQFLCDVGSESFAPKVKDPNTAVKNDHVPYAPVSGNLDTYCEVSEVSAQAASAADGVTQIADRQHKHKHKKDNNTRRKGKHRR